VCMADSIEIPSRIIKPQLMVNSQILKLLALLLFAITLVPMTACGIIEREIDEKSSVI